MGIAKSSGHLFGSQSGAMDGMMTLHSCGCCKPLFLQLLAYVAQILADESVQVTIHHTCNITRFMPCNSQAKGSQTAGQTD